MTLTFDAEKHEYRFDGAIVPSVTQILSRSGIIDARWYTEESRARGQAVHVATQYIDEGDIDWASIHPTITPYVEAYQAFLRESNFQPRLIEYRLYNPRYGYAGTVDREGILNGRDTIIDLKTGTAQPWAALQTAAYAACFDRPIQRYALELRNDGTYRLHNFIDGNDIKIFLSALAVERWKENHGG